MADPRSIDPSEQHYADAMQRVFSDPDIRRRLETDPIGTLEGLGFDLSDEAKAEIQAGPTTPELGVAAVPAVLVRVATNGTRPAVSVVVRTSTVSDTRGRAAELDESP